MKKIITHVFTSLLLSFSLTTLADQSKHSVKGAPFVKLSIGEIGVSDGINQPQFLSVDYIAKDVNLGGYKLSPNISYSWSREGTEYISISFSYDYYLAQNWVLSPSFGLGLFSDGSEIQLGHSLEFITGLELSYETSNNLRLGIKGSHLSNGGLSSTNPGTEILALTISFPFDIK